MGSGLGGVGGGDFWSGAGEGVLGRGGVIGEGVVSGVRGVRRIE